MNRSHAIKRISILGFLGNLFLLIIKLLIGFHTGSQAMIADGLNSAGDVFSSVMTYIGNYISSQPDDKDHPYGHGKAEYIFSFIISFSFLFVAYFILRSGVKRIFSPTRIDYSFGLIIVAIITLLTKICLFFYAHKIGKKHNSLLAYANAQDHRNDLFITSLTLLSIICTYYQIAYIDSIVAILISLWIGYTGFQVLLSSYNVLMDRTLDENIWQEIKKLVLNTEGVDHFDSMVASPIGQKFLILLKISVDGNITVQAGHDITDRVKAKIMDYEEIADVIIHVNPAQTHPQRDYLK